MFSRATIMLGMAYTVKLFRPPLNVEVQQITVPSPLNFDDLKHRTFLCMVQYMNG